MKKYKYRGGLLRQQMWPVKEKVSVMSEECCTIVSKQKLLYY
jgi:hypothetical protein